MSSKTMRMKSVVRNMANTITCIRILCAIALLFCRPLSPLFYALYITAGITDMIDGPVARKTNTVSEFGSGLDTAADFILVTACLIKLLPELDIPVWMSICIAVIAMIKVINIVYGCVMKKRFTAVHTVMNRITGFLLFVLPLTLKKIDLKYSGAAACTVALFAAIQEGHFIRTGKEQSTAKTGI